MQRGWPVAPLSPFSQSGGDLSPPNYWYSGGAVLSLNLRNLNMGTQIYTQGHTLGNWHKWGPLPHSSVGFQGPPKGDNRQGTRREHSWALGRRKPKLRGPTSAPSLSPFARHLVGAGRGKYNPDSAEGIFSLPRREVGYLPTGFESTGYKSLVSGINTKGSSLLPQSCQSEEDMAIPSWSSWADGED